tara:strand:+ start:2709 stop:2879 length:171 start_codon:yes stop_codon:yes gene_type:complete
VAVVALQPVAVALVQVVLVQVVLVAPVVLATPVVVASAENPVKGRPSLSRLLQAEC